MLLDQHARGQRLFGVVLEHGHRCLRDDGAVVEFGCDEVDRAAMNLHTGVKGAAMRAQPGKCGQQQDKRSCKKKNKSWYG